MSEIQEINGYKIKDAQAREYIEFLMKKNSLITESNPVVGYAWRGLSTEAPENSIPAIIKAGTNGCFGVEIDVQVTSDGEFVLMHDATVDRTTNGTGTVNEMSYSAISSLLMDVGNFVENYNNNDLGVPKLETALRLCRQFNLNIMIELKGNFSETSIDNLLHLIKVHNMVNFITIQAYNDSYLELIRQKNAFIKLCLIRERVPNVEDINAAIALKPSFINIAFQSSDTVIPEETRLNMLENNVNFGFSVITASTDITNIPSYNLGCSFLISSIGSPAPNKRNTKHLFCELASDKIKIWNEKASSRMNDYFTCTTTDNVLYTIKFATPFYSRDVSYNGIAIESPFYNTNSKYKLIFSGPKNESLGVRFLNTETNNYVPISEVYNALGGVRFGIVVIGNSF